MQFLKTMCVVVVLGALAYGAWTTLSGPPAPEPPLDAANWDSPPKVGMPGAGDVAAAGSFNTANLPAGPNAPRFQGGASVGAGSAGTAQIAPGGPLSPTAGDASRSTTDAPPSSFPKTNVAAGPFDGTGAIQLAGATSGGVTPAGALTAAIQGSNVVQAAPGGATGSPIAGTNDIRTFPQAMQELQGLIEQKKFTAALYVLSQWFDSPSLSPEDARGTQQLLDQLAGAVIYSQDHLVEPPHVVAQGESLLQIADKCQVPVELLAKINGITNPLYLPAGTQLKIVKGPFDAVVDKSRRQLTLFLDGMYAGSFTVGFGRELMLPDGRPLDCVVQSKSVNPVYQATDGVIAADDPRNPLGERWIDLGNQQGIHGTDDPTSLNRDDARGCIRLNPNEIADVYDILSVGSRVRIRQ